jgi:hypothetical protein
MKERADWQKIICARGHVLTICANLTYEEFIELRTQLDMDLYQIKQLAKGTENGAS